MNSDSGGVEQVGDSYRDMMGFVIIGPDEFLASGHPDVPGMVAGDPGLLGLLRSVDGGLTWKSKSLLGDGDLHELVQVVSTLLAWDAASSDVMVSRDLRSWERRSTIEDLTDLAVDPANPSHVLAVTQTGVLKSTDGGRSWEPVDAPRGLVLQVRSNRS